MADAYLKVKDNGANGLSIVREESDVSVTDLKSAVDYSRITFTAGRAIQDNRGDGTVISLTTVPGGNYSSAVIDCVEGDRFTISGSGGSSYRLWCFIDSNNVAIQTAKSGATASNLILKAPKDSAKLILNNTDTSNSFKGISVAEETRNIDSVFADDSGIEKIEFQNNSYVINCAADLSSLRPTQSANAYRYALVECVEGENFTISCTGGSSPRAYAFLNANLEILKSAPGGAAFENYIITAPAYSAWLIINDLSNAGYAFRGVTSEARRKLLDSVLYIPETIASDSDCVAAFVTEMNSRAKTMGMDDTIFTTPSGINSSNKSTSVDMLKMAWMATAYREILEIWSLPSADVVINGEKVSVENSYLTSADSAITNGKLLGGKGGNLSNNYRTQIDLIDIDGVPCIVVVMGVNETDYAKIYADANAVTKMLADYIKTGQYITPADISGLVSRGGSYAAMAIPGISASAYSANYPITSLKSRGNILYGGENNICVPCSIQKTMNAMIVIDTLPDLNAVIAIHSSDLVGGSGITLNAGDTMTARDALVLSMINSNNATATALARIAGNLLI